MTREEYIRKWLEGTLTEEEKVVFESSDDFRKLEKLNEALTSFKAPSYNVEASLNELKSRKQKAGKSVSFSWMKSFVRVAAVLLLIISSYFFFYLNINQSVIRMQYQSYYSFRFPAQFLDFFILFFGFYLMANYL